MNPAFLEQFSRIGKALANPLRLDLLDLLCQSEKSVETLVEQTGQNVKNVSAQLRVLKETNLVKTRRDGKNIFYSIQDERIARFWMTFQQFGAEQLWELQKLTKQLIGEIGSAEKLGRNDLYIRAKKDEVMIIDVRPLDEFTEAHIPFAVCVPLEDLQSRLRKFPKSKKIVAYCRGPHCLLAVEAVRILRKNGFDAQRMEFGVQQWKSLGLPMD